MTLRPPGPGRLRAGRCFETSLEGSRRPRPCRWAASIDVGGYHLVAWTRSSAWTAPTTTPSAAIVRVTRRRPAVCEAEPERRCLPAGGQTTSEVGHLRQGPQPPLRGAGRAARPTAGPSGWCGPTGTRWASLIFLGPVIMALGGLVSLSDRRLRLRRRRVAPEPVGREAPPAPLVAAFAAVLCMAARLGPRPSASPIRPRRPAPAPCSARSAAWSARTSRSTTARPTSPTTCASMVREQVAGRAGATRRSSAFLTDRYGEFVLLKPRFFLGNAALWLAPFLVVAFGLLFLRGRLCATAPVPEAALSIEEEARLARLEKEDRP